MEYTGSVRTKRGKNGEVSYQIVIEGERDPVTGKRMRSYQTVHCKKREAIRLMNQIVAEKNAGTYFKASHLLLRDWLEQWYRDYCTGHLEKTTLASYRDKIDHYINPVLGNIPLGKLTGQDQPDCQKIPGVRQPDQPQIGAECSLGAAPGPRPCRRSSFHTGESGGTGGSA